MNDRSSLLALAVAVEGGLIVLAWLPGWLLGVPIWETIDWSLSGVALGLAASVPMMLMFGVCLAWPVGPLLRIKEFGEKVIYPLFAPLSLAELALICVLAGFGEELFFRAFLQGGLEHWVETWAALLIASLVFGLVHAITPTYALLAAVIGAYLGACWLWTGNLLAPVVAHGFYDFVALVYLLRIDPPPPPPEPIPTPPAEAPADPSPHPV